MSFTLNESKLNPNPPVIVNEAPQNAEDYDSGDENLDRSIFF